MHLLCYSVVIAVTYSCCSPFKEEELVLAAIYQCFLCRIFFYMIWWWISNFVHVYFFSQYSHIWNFSFRPSYLTRKELVLVKSKIGWLDIKDAVLVVLKMKYGFGTLHKGQQCFFFAWWNFTSHVSSFHYCSVRFPQHFSRRYDSSGIFKTSFDWDEGVHNRPIQAQKAKDLTTYHEQVTRDTLAQFSGSHSVKWIEENERQTTFGLKCCVRPGKKW